jgi:hypothetical protein
MRIIPFFYRRKFLLAAGLVAGLLCFGAQSSHADSLYTYSYTYKFGAGLSDTIQWTTSPISDPIPDPTMSGTIPSAALSFVSVTGPDLAGCAIANINLNAMTFLSVTVYGITNIFTQPTSCAFGGRGSGDVWSPSVFTTPGTYTFSAGIGSLTVSQVPEAGIPVMLSMGLLGLVFFSKRSKFHSVSK